MKENLHQTIDDIFEACLTEDEKEILIDDLQEAIENPWHDGYEISNFAMKFNFHYHDVVTWWQIYGY